MLNTLVSEQDLAKLTANQREFLVQRIDHALDNDPKVREIIAATLQKSVNLIAPDVKVLK